MSSTFTTPEGVRVDRNFKTFAGNAANPKIRHSVAKAIQRLANRHH